ncbi:FKBP-type peptidyl-prolyl cis-trans isomerase [Aestuariicella hydrocarbonica]|uniref:Peptidyl-prolyl cis-trans isomerase n=1 Tax=Pseudomaricurvus hydrocarbonicus TaxID=1470433 RepID=A0A9E5MQ38_9GAMM|nr:FKBP-type peptidyl-prolyl cis-trans isomerase [Aestuariicella hydrocarbonica]NHO68428.1 FKBP-type peptidyl-prolyl cis-trans isomerase [Aestuariicella hydrocarbonica]
MISRKLLIGTAASALMLVGMGQQVMADEMKDLSDKASYIFGYKTGERLKDGPIEIDADIFTKAIKEGLKGSKPSMTEEEMQATMMALQEIQQQKQMEAMKVVAEANQKEGEAFLAANAKKDGVKTTDSGLQYKVLTKGKGAKPNKDSQVSVNYRGTLIDGSEFDSSERHGGPATFGVTQVITGWTEALMMMPEGSKWEVYIPSELAYGAGGAGGEIGPNATLIFEIELLDAGVK